MTEEAGEKTKDRKEFNEFEKALTYYIDKDALIRIQNSYIGIAGAGGLGSNVALNLTRSGFKNFTIVDFDKIEYSNLNRQFYFYKQTGKAKVFALKENLLIINPNLNIKVYQEKINEQNINFFFKDCDVIIEALDKAKYKKMLVENYINSKKLIVAASGIGGCGESDAVKIHKIRQNLYIVGDLKTEVDEKNPPFAPKVNIAAAKQADIVFEYFLK